MKIEKFNYILDVLESQAPSMFKHSERVAMMCYEFSKKFDIENEDRGVLYMAGFLHEIGKYGNPDELSVGNLKVKLQDIYPIISKSIIATADGFNRVAKIVEQHLENLDGTGKPFGLKAEQIHLYSTMVHLCDFYDHCRMNGDSHSLATSRIRKQQDIMFPKKMITPFIKMLVTCDDLIKMYNDLGDLK